jgi:hypothetical protein
MIISQRLFDLDVPVLVLVAIVDVRLVPGGLQLPGRRLRAWCRR